MNLPVTFHRAANTEFIAATVWYEDKRLGLGLKFVAEIERCVSLASKHPQQFVIIYQDIRRVVANRFPYSIYFRVAKNHLVVLAVFHGRRDPIIWQDRKVELS